MTDLLRIERVLERVALSRSALYRRLATGTFPRPFPLSGSKYSVWSSDEIDAWINQQIPENEERK